MMQEGLCQLVQNLVNGVAFFHGTYIDCQADSSPPYNKGVPPNRPKMGPWYHVTVKTAIGLGSLKESSVPTAPKAEELRMGI